MKVFRYIILSVYSIFFTSPVPKLFGSRKRRKEKSKLANEFKGMASETQSDIEALKVQNPFESAAAKSAMSTASRNIRQQQQRAMNILGSGASPEAVIASQQAGAEGIGSAAGQIAVGAEGQKAQEIAALRGLKSQQLGQYGQVKQSSINERGSGWKDFFTAAQQIGDVIGNVASVS